MSITVPSLQNVPRCRLLAVVRVLTIFERLWFIWRSIRMNLHFATNLRYAKKSTMQWNASWKVHIYYAFGDVAVFLGCGGIESNPTCVVAALSLHRRRFWRRFSLCRINIRGRHSAVRVVSETQYYIRRRLGVVSCLSLRDFYVKSIQRWCKKLFRPFIMMFSHSCRAFWEAASKL